MDRGIDIFIIDTALFREAAPSVWSLDQFAWVDLSILHGVGGLVVF